MKFRILSSFQTLKPLTRRRWIRLEHRWRTLFWMRLIASTQVRRHVWTFCTRMELVDDLRQGEVQPKPKSGWVMKVTCIPQLANLVNHTSKTTGSVGTAWKAKNTDAISRFIYEEIRQCWEYRSEVDSYNFAWETRNRLSRSAQRKNNVIEVLKTYPWRAQKGSKQ